MLWRTCLIKHAETLLRRKVSCTYLVVCFALCRRIGLSVRRHPLEDRMGAAVCQYKALATETRAYRYHVTSRDVCRRSHTVESIVISARHTSRNSRTQCMQLLICLAIERQINGWAAYCDTTGSVSGMAAIAGTWRCRDSHSCDSVHYALQLRRAEQVSPRGVARDAGTRFWKSFLSFTMYKPSIVVTSTYPSRRRSVKAKSRHACCSPSSGLCRAHCTPVRTRCS
jgi:hypothetical protein